MNKKLDISSNKLGKLTQTNSFKSITAAVLCAIIGIIIGARKNCAIQPLIDAIVEYLPSPLEIPPAVGFHTKKEEKVEIPCNPSGMVSGLVFKIQYDREAGSLCYVRMYSGKLKTGEQLSC